MSTGPTGWPTERAGSSGRDRLGAAWHDRAVTRTGPPNAEMRRHWSEVAGPRWVRARNQHDALLAPFHGPLLAAAGARTGERGLDAGCGFGTTTLALAAQVGPTGSVVGADISSSMIAELERRVAERDARDATATDDVGGAPIETLLADVQVGPLPGPFDLVVSRFGIMFFDDPSAAWANLQTATRPGGRLAFVCWQQPEDNPWSRVPALAALAVSPSDVEPPGPDDPGPSSLADPARVRSLLGAAGWQQVRLTDLRPRVTIGRDLDGAVEQVRSLTSVAGAIERVGESAVLPAVRSALEPHVGDDGAVRLAGAAWLVTAVA
ncbi:MAG: class I SAM-dependent methyltransferase [Actinomycetes bacterium]